MPADPVAAGRKGGQSRSAKKLTACKRNGFQKVKPTPAEPAPHESRSHRARNFDFPIFEGSDKRTDASFRGPKKPETSFFGTRLQASGQQPKCPANRS